MCRSPRPVTGNHDAWLPELAAVSEAIRAITSSLELPEVLRVVLGRIRTSTQAEAVSLLLYDNDSEELIFAADGRLRESTLAGLRGEAGGGLAAYVAHRGESVRLNDAGEAQQLGIDPAEMTYVERNLLAVPVEQEGRVIGAVELADRYGGEFSEKDEERLVSLAGELAARDDLDALAGDAKAVGDLFARVTAAIPSEDVTLVLVGPDGRDRLLGASRRLQAGEVDGLRLRLDQGIAGWVARHRTAVRIDDVPADPRYYAEIGRMTGFSPRTMICVPMLMRGRLLGVIQCLNKLGGDRFDEAELQLVQTLAEHAAIAIENASLYREAYLASLTDDLTGLSNTRHFHSVLPRLLAPTRPPSLIVLDLDHFKAVVDGHGHLVGSRTIAQVGRLVASRLRNGDIAARFGGDEFVVILPDTRPGAALALAEEIRTDIEAMDRLDGTDIDVSGVTASFGVASFPNHADTAESLFQEADRAMYDAKAKGKNCVCLASVGGKG
jgi:diguanylate cyclase (GGDEF)-like protein